MYWFYLTFLVGCSGGKFEDYNKYLIDFSNDAAAIGKTAPDFSQTYFVSNDSSELDAECPDINKRLNGPVIIYIGKKFKDLSEDSQRLMIYHEIGHCFYGLQHATGYHIMNSQISSYAQLLFYKDSRLKFVEQIMTY